MRTLWSVYRVLRVLLFIYGVSNALLRSRWLRVALVVMRMLQKRRVRNVRRAAAIEFVDGSDAAIYRREGWRRIRIRDAATHR